MTQPRYLLVNTGNANAGTGEQGINDASTCCELVAEATSVSATEVLPFSTGVIGEPFPTEKVIRGIKDNAKKLTNTKVAGSLTANAILTTDTFAKCVWQPMIN